MKPQMFALATAIAWGVGGFFEKKGLQLGGLAPQMGITLRTFVAACWAQVSMAMGLV